MTGAWVVVNPDPEDPGPRERATRPVPEDESWVPVGDISGPPGPPGPPGATGDSPDLQDLTILFENGLF